MCIKVSRMVAASRNIIILLNRLVFRTFKNYENFMQKFTKNKNDENCLWSALYGGKEHTEN